MLKQQARIVAFFVFLLDLAIAVGAFFLAFFFRNTVLPFELPRVFPTPLYPLEQYSTLLPYVLAVWSLALVSGKRYHSHRTVPLKREVLGILRACVLAGLLLTALVFLLRLDFVSRPWIALFTALAFLALASEKIFLRLLSRYVRARGYNYRTIAICGTSPQALEMAALISEHKYWGLRIAGFIAENGESAAPGGYRLLGRVDGIEEILRREVIDEIVFVVGRRKLDQLEEVMLICHDLGVRTRLALNAFPHWHGTVDIEDLDGVPLLTFSKTPENQLQLFVKRSLDVAFSLALMLLSLPILLATALLIRITSRGDVLFKQRRCGLNGRNFVLYKFRTMVAGAEDRRHEVEHLNELNGPAFKSRNDPRVTWLGRFLRRLSLDELPQLWNVLKGDMSLVGPRPPIPEEVERYTRWQRRRLSMKPGITGLWQVSGRADHPDFEKWVELDLEYIDNWSPMLDFKILLKTIPAVLGGKGAA